MTVYRRGAAMIRYGRDNKELRLALLKEWAGCCYWCRELLTLAAAEIDHIIPRNTRPHRLAELIELYKLPDDFHLHDLANLAPICGPCNKQKRDSDFLQAPLVIGKLREARQRAQKVDQRVRDYRQSFQVGQHLIEAVSADLTSPRARHEFLELAPAVVQTLALLDERRADFLVRRRVYMDFGGDELSLAVTLDARGRARWAWVEDLCGRPWLQLLQDGMRDVSRHTEAMFERAIRTECGGAAQVDSREATELSAVLELDDIRRDGSLLACHLRGQVDAYYDLVLEDFDPECPFETATYMPADAQMNIEFSLAISWDLAAPDSRPASTTVEIISEDVLVGVDRKMK